jgi:Domain of unknown function (DUF4202)
MNGRLEAVLAAIDAANAADPARQDGEPAALVYGRRMSEVLDDFAPGASDHLKIACRGQHIERWTRPRADWPEGRAGYLRWRTELKAYHAERVMALMAEAGWPEPNRARVGSLIRKEGLKRDPEAQTLEDVACLVFMRWYFAPFAETQSTEKIVGIVAKTGRKMSAEGRVAALALGLPDHLAAALEDG